MYTDCDFLIRLYQEKNGERFCHLEKKLSLGDFPEHCFSTPILSPQAQQLDTWTMRLLVFQGPFPKEREKVVYYYHYH